MSLPAARPPFYADPEVVALGHERALWRSWLREELFMVRMYWDAHLWPMPREYSKKEKDTILYALASFSYLMRLVRLGQFREKWDRITARAEAQAKKEGAGEPRVRELIKQFLEAP